MTAAGQASEAHAAAAIAARRTDLAAAAGVLLASLALAGLAAWIVVARVTRPLARLEAATARLAQGDLAVTLPGAARRDEVGRLAGAIRVLQDGLLAKARLEASQTEERAAAEAEKRNVVQAMAEQVEAAAREAVSAIEIRSQAMSGDAAALAAMAAEVAGTAVAMEATAARVLADGECGAAATEELAASIRAVAGQVEGATAAARRAVDRTETSQATIAGLAEAASRIGDVVRLISDIAGRTNLLALNATIEAARAGEAGKGFAVVASEVKALASQTARATEEIARQVSGIGSATSGAVAAVAEIAAAIQETDSAAATITAVIDQQAKATAEIAETVARTTAAAREVSERAGEVAAAIGGAGTRADAVRGAAAGTAEATATLQASIVRIIRTATPEAERRGEPRRPGQGRRAMLGGLDGGPASGELIDVSAGGAALLLPPGSPAPRVGQPVTLTLDGEPARPGARVLEVSLVREGGLRVRLAFAGDARRAA
nr:methyl-accepting chemotaxis protein [Paracraurococcus ruber]